VAGQKPREIAARLLLGSGPQASYIEDRLEVALPSLNVPDRGLCQELVYGVIRWQAALDWLIARKTSGRTQKSGLQTLLRLGLYQMFWLDRVPDHAAVNETVELARQMGFGAQAGFVNAILRGYSREREESKRLLGELKANDLAVGYSHPEWLVRRWQNRWTDDDIQRLLEWNNNPPPTFARVSRLKADAVRLTGQWRSEGVEFEPARRDWIDEGQVFELKSHPPLATLQSFQQGLFYVQDPSTLLAVRILGPQPGETILDFCAAPGGKSVFIAELMENRGRLIAQDRVTARLKMIRENCDRLGVTCAQTSKYDGAIFPELNIHFDRVLLDVPCSNTGVIRRRIELRWSVREAEIQRLAAAQIELIEDAAGILKPGGVLVYSTCSLEPEENSGLVRSFLASHREFTLEVERELLPFRDGVDGAYVARLVKA
jgi:16S rRNA (cytosine967-C5)-methyltransferase